MDTTGSSLRANTPLHRTSLVRLPAFVPSCQQLDCSDCCFLLGMACVAYERASSCEALCAYFGFVAVSVGQPINTKQTREVSHQH